MQVSGTRFAQRARHVPGEPPSSPARPRVRFVFSQVEHARATLHELVGEELAAELDWSTLRVEPGTYVEEALLGSMSDLVFSACFRGSARRALVYLLWDHQRQPDRMMPLRLHNYGGRALHDYTQRGDAIPGYVPTLIPILVYQGPGEWPGPYLLRSGSSWRRTPSGSLAGSIRSTIRTGTMPIEC